MQMPQLPPEINTGQWYIIVTSIIGFLTTILTLIINSYVTAAREKRQREWDLQDRALAREQLRAETRAAADKLESKTEQTRYELVQKIDKNTELTAAAAVASNAVDMKFKAIDAMINDVKTTAQLSKIATVAEEAKEVAKEAKATATDTQTLVREKLGGSSGGTEETHAKERHRQR